MENPESGNNRPQECRIGDSPCESALPMTVLPEIQFSQKAREIIQLFGLEEKAGRAMDGIRRILHAPSAFYDAVGFKAAALLYQHDIELAKTPLRRLYHYSINQSLYPEADQGTIQRAVEKAVPLTEAQQLRQEALNFGQLVVGIEDIQDPHELQFSIAHALNAGMPIVYTPAQEGELDTIRTAVYSALQQLGLDPAKFSVIKPHEITPLNAHDIAATLGDVPTHTADFVEGLISQAFQQMRRGLKEVMPFLTSVVRHHRLTESQKSSLVGEILMHVMPKENIIPFFRARRERLAILQAAKKNGDPIVLQRAQETVRPLTDIIISQTLEVARALAVISNTTKPIRTFVQIVAEISGASDQDVKYLLKCFQDNGIIGATLHKSSNLGGWVAELGLGLAHHAWNLTGWPSPFLRPEDCTQFARERLYDWLTLEAFAATGAALITTLANRYGNHVEYSQIWHALRRTHTIMMLPGLFPYLQRLPFGLNVEVLEELFGPKIARFFGWFKYAGVEAIGIGYAPQWFSRMMNMFFSPYFSSKLKTEALVSQQPLLLFFETADGKIKMSPMDSFQALAPGVWLRWRSQEVKIGIRFQKLGINSPVSYVPHIGFLRKIDDILQKWQWMRQGFRYLDGGYDITAEHTRSPGAQNTPPLSMRWMFAALDALYSLIPRINVYQSEPHMLPTHRIEVSASDTKRVPRDLPHLIAEWASTVAIVQAHLAAFYIFLEPILNSSPEIATSFIGRLFHLHHYAKVAGNPDVQELNRLFVEAFNSLGGGGLDWINRRIGASGTPSDSGVTMDALGGTPTPGQLRTSFNPGSDPFTRLEQLESTFGQIIDDAGRVLDNIRCWKSLRSLVVQEIDTAGTVLREVTLQDIYLE